MQAQKLENSIRCMETDRTGVNGACMEHAWNTATPCEPRSEMWGWGMFGRAVLLLGFLHKNKGGIFSRGMKRSFYRPLFKTILTRSQ